MKREATDLLIRHINPKLKDALKKRARAHNRSLSEETKAVLEEALKVGKSRKKMGTWMFSLLPPEYRGDDFEFEVHEEMREPPDFE
jgi:antitoxin FitA